ncbi:MAG: hypothetical protein ACTSQJ_08800 [Promethearchaeota archaeon]
MCEFKIVRKNDNSQVGEEIVVIGYSENNELIFSDILGESFSLNSALILNVNTLNQTLTVVEHPLIKDFLSLINKITNKTLKIDDINKFKSAISKILNK